MDNGSRIAARCVARLQAKHPRLVPVHGPVHASWLNQIEIYFSIVQRKVLTPNDFPSLAAVKQRLLAFQTRYEALAQPFEWKFTRHDLARLLNKFRSHSDPWLRAADDLKIQEQGTSRLAALARERQTVRRWWRRRTADSSASAASRRDTTLHKPIPLTTAPIA
jgi:hypothetical protein